MADKRISQLVDRGTVVNNDVIPIVVSGATTTNKATISSIQTFMQGNLDVGVTSVGITLGSTGTDVNVSGSPVTSSGNITINIPSASATNRGLVTTGAQTFAGAKTTTSNINVNGVYVGRGASGGDLFAGIAGNTAVGTQALLSITTGYPNTALGSEALRNITTGANNIAIGSEAGKIDSGSSTANATSSSSIYIGDNTKPQTNGNTNEIVIGHATSGNGSNTVTIGNSSTTFNKFFGATQSDTFRLPSDGGGNQVTVFENIGVIHTGSAGSNIFGFNNSNNIYFGKGLSNGGVIQWTNAAVRYYTLPDADGTIALTSNLSAYLPLAGGTLTGVLNGTSASFTGRARFQGTGFDTLGSAEIMLSNSTTSAGRSYIVNSSNAGEFLISDASAAQTRLSINNSGAVTLTGALNGTSATFSGAINLTGTANSFQVASIFRNANRIFFGGDTGGYLFQNSGNTATIFQLADSGAATFSGALNGTSASFTGNAQADFFTVGTTAATSGGVRLGTQVAIRARNVANTANIPLIESTASDGVSVSNGALILASTGAATFSSTVQAGGEITTGSVNRAFLRQTAGGDAELGCKTGGNTSIFSNGTAALTLSPTGAATFSSSVTANGNSNTFGNASLSGKAVIIQAGSTNQAIMFKNSAGGDATLFINGTSTSVDYNFNTYSVGDALVIKNNGNVGIGTASPNSKLEVVGGNNLPPSTGTQNYTIALRDPTSMVADVGGSILFQGFKTSTSAIGNFAYIAGKKENGTAGNEAGYLSLGTFNSSGIPTEKMRITSGGYLKASNTGSYDNTSSSSFEFINNTAGGNSLLVRNTSTSYTAALLRLTCDRTSTNAAYYLIIATNGNSTGEFRVADSGNVTNTNNSYGAISDIKLKENIEDATPKLDDLMKVKVRNYNLIGDDKKQIGVIAQELEEVFPAMIDESEDFEEVEVPQLDEEGNEVLNEEGEVVTEKQRVSKGTTTKSVKYSVFVPMLIKAMQEQQEQIKELKTEIDSLKNQIK